MGFRVMVLVVPFRVSLVPFMVPSMGVQYRAAPLDLYTVLPVRVGRPSHQSVMSVRPVQVKRHRTHDCTPPPSELASSREGGLIQQQQQPETEFQMSIIALNEMERSIERTIQWKFVGDQRRLINVYTSFSVKTRRPVQYYTVLLWRLDIHDVTLGVIELHADSHTIYRTGTLEILSFVDMQVYHALYF